MGCGPLPRSGPLTARQARYVEELEAFEAGGRLETGHATTAEIEAERPRLYDRALPPACSEEPTDLLELLAMQPPPANRPPVDRPAAPTGNRATRGTTAAGGA